MKIQKMRDQLASGKVLFGLSMMFPAPGMIRAMCKGWDFVWIDGQHGMMSYDSIQHALDVADAVGIESIVRVAGDSPDFLGVYADLAPSAIMIPMVDTPQQAENIAKCLKFPPKGTRSFGGRRVIDKYGPEYIETQDLIVIAQVETMESVDNAEAIIQTDGIDMLFFGPDDMKISLGLPRSATALDTPVLMDAMKRTADAAKKAGKLCGSVAISNELIALTVKLGYQVIAAGGDISFLRSSAGAKLQEIKALGEIK